jgi:hypothetical protein
MKSSALLLVVPLYSVHWNTAETSRCKATLVSLFRPGAGDERRPQLDGYNNHKKPQSGKLVPGPDLDPGPSEYESEVLTSMLRCS